jgi:hypothetical protein
MRKGQIVMGYALILAAILARGPLVWGEYRDNGDGTVSDNVTGLMWQRADDGELRNWEAALAYCEGLELAGHDDWRLPNVRELESIVDRSRYNPSIDPVFACRSSCYWSGNTYASDPDYPYCVGFFNGYVNWLYKRYHLNVRCVRGGP